MRLLSSSVAKSEPRGGENFTVITFPANTRGRNIAVAFWTNWTINSTLLHSYWDSNCSYAPSLFVVKKGNALSQQLSVTQV